MVNDTNEATDHIAASVPGIAANLLNIAVLAVQRIGGSGNNRVYHLACENSHEYVAKFYFRNPADKRDRLEAEFNSFLFLSSQGMTNIPRPVAISRDESCAVYEFIEGKKITPGETREEDITCALNFVADLKRLNKPAFSENILPASDACFSIAAVVANVEGRLNRFAKFESHEPEYRELESFLENDFKPFLGVLTKWAEEQCAIKGISFDGEVPLEQRTLSPSDFGFHNALRAKDGRIVFLDFEYFGWDDPAKMVVDYLLHPAMGLSESMKKKFVSGMLDIFKENHRLADRVKLVYPLFAMKWCTILLNEFVPNDFSRRAFAAASPLDRSQVRHGQLLKAKNLYQNIKATYLEFMPMHKAKTIKLDERSKYFRRRMIETLKATRRGHVGAALSLIEILRVLYDDILRYDPKNPKWSERDRCILSKGHGCLALYVVLQDKGFFPEEELWRFCEEDGLLGGHPEVKVPGVEASTGSLGHGLPIGVGLAINARHDKGHQRIFVIVGDGECNEGSVWEAALCAGKHKLNNLTVVVDYNKYQSYGPTSQVQDLEPFADKWKAFGFAVQEVNGHDVAALRAAFSALPVDPHKPTAVICHTLKGKGMNCTEGNLKWHHKSGLKDEEISQLFAELEAN